MYKIQKKIWIFFLGCVFYGQHNLRGQLSEFPIQESLYPNGTLEEHFEVMWGKSLLMQNMKSGDSLGAATILLTNHFLSIKKSLKKFFRIGGMHIYLGAFFDNPYRAVEFMLGQEFWPKNFFQGEEQEKSSVLNAKDYQSFNNNMYQTTSNVNVQFGNAQLPQTSSVSSTSERIETHSLRERVLAVSAAPETIPPEDAVIDIDANSNLVHFELLNSELAENDEGEDPENNALLHMIIQNDEALSVHQETNARAVRLNTNIT